MDRPLGSHHPRHPGIVYPINYGYVNGLFAPDGEEQDVYIFGANEPLADFSGVVIAVYHRYNNVEDKCVVSVDGKPHSDDEILCSIEFQEQYFKGELFR